MGWVSRSPKNLDTKLQKLIKNLLQTGNREVYKEDKKGGQVNKRDRRMERGSERLLTDYIQVPLLRHSLKLEGHTDVERP